MAITYRKLRTSARLLLAAVADLGSRASSSEAAGRLLLTAHDASPRAGRSRAIRARVIVAQLPRGILRCRYRPEITLHFLLARANGRPVRRRPRRRPLAEPGGPFRLRSATDHRTAAGSIASRGGAHRRRHSTSLLTPSWLHSQDGSRVSGSESRRAASAASSWAASGLVTPARGSFDRATSSRSRRAL